MLLLPKQGADLYLFVPDLKPHPAPKPNEELENSSRFKFRALLHLHNRRHNTNAIYFLHPDQNHQHVIVKHTMTHNDAGFILLFKNLDKGIKTSL